MRPVSPVRPSREAEVVQLNRSKASAWLQPTPRPSSACARNRLGVHSVPHKSKRISGDIQCSSSPPCLLPLNMFVLVSNGQKLLPNRQQSDFWRPTHSCVMSLAGISHVSGVKSRPGCFSGSPPSRECDSARRQGVYEPESRLVQCL